MNYEVEGVRAAGRLKEAWRGCGKRLWNSTTKQGECYRL